MVSFRHRQNVDPELQLFFQEMAARQEAALETSSPRRRYFERIRRLRRQPVVQESDSFIVDNVQFSPYKQPLPTVRFSGLYATSTPKSRYRNKRLIEPVFERMYPPLEINPAAARLIEANRRYKRQNAIRMSPRIVLTPVVERGSRLAGYRRPLVISSPVRRKHNLLLNERLPNFFIE